MTLASTLAVPLSPRLFCAAAMVWQCQPGVTKILRTTLTSRVDSFPTSSCLALRNVQPVRGLCKFVCLAADRSRFVGLWRQMTFILGVIEMSELYYGSNTVAGKVKKVLALFADS